MCRDAEHPLTFDNVLSDPLIRMVMKSDGVEPQTLMAILIAARAAREFDLAPAWTLSDAPARGCAMLVLA